MFLKDLLIKNQLSKYDSFIWDSKVKKIKNIQSLNFIDINLLVGIDRQKKILFQVKLKI